MATSAFPLNPTSLATANNIFRYKPKGGDPKVHYVPVKSSETIKRNDFLKITQGSNSDQVERALDPAGTAATVTLAGDSGGIPQFIALHDFTSGASQTENDKIACYSVYDLLFLMRIYHSTASSAEIEEIRINVRPNNFPVGGTALATDFYGWGIYEYSTTAYYPILDATNQDSTNGSLAIVEAATEFDVADDFGGVWVAFTGLA